MPNAGGEPSKFLTTLSEIAYIRSAYSGKQWDAVDDMVYRNSESLLYTLAPEAYSYYIQGLAQYALESKDVDAIYALVASLAYHGEEEPREDIVNYLGRLSHKQVNALSIALRTLIRFYREEDPLLAGTLADCIKVFRRKWRISLQKKREFNVPT